MHYTYPCPLPIVVACFTGEPLDVRTVNDAPFAERHRSRHAQRFVPVLLPSSHQDPGKRLKELCVGVRVH